MNTEHPMFTESVTRSRDASRTKMAAGVIYEVAKRKCGGLDDLNNAIRENRVIEKGGLYYFRSDIIKDTRSFTRTETAARSGQTAQTTFNALALAVDDMSEIVSGAASAGGEELDESKSVVETLPESNKVAKAPADIPLDKDELKSDFDCLKKSIGLAEKARDFALDNKSHGDRHARAIEELATTLENADDLVPIVAKAIKYNKDSNGTALKQSDFDAMKDEVNAMTAGLLADVKTMRCHEPKKAKKVE